MPIAAAKLEKQSSTEAAEPLKMAMIVLEHKIRNLEKRKRKIEIYRENQSRGQTLNSDQLAAVAKFNEVTKTLDFAQELYKQFQGIATETGKGAKKQLRKDAIERAVQEVSKVKDILLIQDILQGMGQENVREDFLAGRNNAIKLSDEDLKFLDDLYLEVAPKRSAPEDGLPPFVDQLSAAAEHLLSIVEGKQKEVVGTSHEYLKQLVNKIQECGYFDQPAVPEALPEQLSLSVGEVVEELVLPVEPVVPVVPVVPLVPVVVPEKQFAQAAMPPAPLAKSLPIPSNLVPVQAVLVPAPAPAAAANIAETVYFASKPVAPEPTNYNSLDQQQTVNELIKTVAGSFNFLQESELDAPGIDSAVIGAVPLPASTIPSQTYTNQNFTAVPAPSAASLPPAQPAGYPSGGPEMHPPMAGFASVSPNPPPPIPMPPSHRGNQYASGPSAPPAAHPEFQQETKAAGEGMHPMHVDSWALGDSNMAGDVGGVAGGNGGAGAVNEWNQHGAGGAGGAGSAEWSQEAAQANDWSLPANDGPGHGRPMSGGRPGHRGGRGGGQRGGNSPSAYNASRGQPRPGNFHNGNRNNGSYGNYPRNQEGHTGGGLGNTSYYQHQNGYQGQQQAQHAQAAQSGQPAREQYNTNGNGNYTSYRSRPAQRAPGTRGSSRGGMGNDGATSQRGARGTAFVGGRPSMNRQ